MSPFSSLASNFLINGSKNTPQQYGFELIAFPSKVVSFSAECPDFADRTAATPRVFRLQTKSNSSFYNELPWTDLPPLDCVEYLIKYI